MDGRPPDAILHSLHHPDCNAAKGDCVIVLTCGSSVISATLETGVTVAAVSGSSLPSCGTERSIVHLLARTFCEGTFLATEVESCPKMWHTLNCGDTVPPKSSKTGLVGGGLSEFYRSIFPKDVDFILRPAIFLGNGLEK